MNRRRLPPAPSPSPSLLIWDVNSWDIEEEIEKTKKVYIYCLDSNSSDAAAMRGQNLLIISSYRELKELKGQTQWEPREVTNCLKKKFSTNLIPLSTNFPLLYRKNFYACSIGTWKNTDFEVSTGSLRKFLNIIKSTCYDLCHTLNIRVNVHTTLMQQKAISICAPKCIHTTTTMCCSGDQWEVLANIFYSG